MGKRITRKKPALTELEIEKHRLRHELLHKQLDELVADFIAVTGKLPSQTTILDLMAWSDKQRYHPNQPTS
jgi:hypothetical protein